MVVAFDVKVTGVDEVLRDLAPAKVRRAVSRAINKTAATAKTAASREMRESYNIKKARLDKNLALRRATSLRPEAVITARGNVPGLQHFGMKGGKRLKSGVIRPVTVEVKKGHRKTVGGGFKAAAGIFKRVGRERLPIKRLYGPDAAAMMKGRGIRAIEKAVDETLQKNLNHELDREWRKK